MKEHEPSWTAMMTALRRAAHQLIDVPPVFEDQLAVRIIGERAQAALQSLVAASPNDIERSLRAFLAARSRYVEDQVADAVQRGIAQFIILGAGLDTFAYRCKNTGLRMFEVDHPATQAWKRQRLDQENIKPPPSLTFVPVDFAQASLDEELFKAGWEAGKPSIISWLGVVQYLSSETVMAMLEFVSSMAAGSEIIFDYPIPPHMMNGAQKAYFENLRASLAASSEPLQSMFAPAMLLARLKSFGFTAVHDLSPQQFNARYFSEREDGLKMSTTISHLAHARV